MLNLSDHTGGTVPVVVPPRDSVTPLPSRVIVATPWQKSVCPVTSFCVTQLNDRRRTGSALNYGDAFVAHSRNSCADQFLKSPAEWLLMIDDDMVVPFGNAEWFRQFTGFNFPDPFMGWNAIDRLLSHGKTLVGALYFGRHKSAPPMYNEGANPQELDYARRGPYDLCKQTRWVGTGCMLVHRTVFEAIEKRFPRLARNSQGTGGQWFTSTEASLLQDIDALRARIQGKKLDGTVAYDVFNGLEGIAARAKNENPLGTGEDVSFCLRAAAAGHPAHVDMGLRCGHIGSAVY